MMDARDITTLAVGYAAFCVFVFAYVMVTMYKHTRGEVSMRDIPLWMLASIAGLSLCPLLNVVMLVKTVRLK